MNLYFSELNNFSIDYFKRNEHLNCLVNEINNKSFFITGANGLFGTWIISYLIFLKDNKLANPKISILLRSKYSMKNPILNKVDEIFYGDIRTFKFPNKCYDFLIHLSSPSAVDTFNGMKDIEKIDQLYLGTKNILNFVKKSIKIKVLMTSSGALFGGINKNNQKIAENLNIAPLTTDNSTGLSLGKRIAETLFTLFCKENKVNFNIARCFSFIGPGLATDLHYAVGNFIQNAVDNKKIIINGDGSPVRSYLYLGDMVYWIMYILIKGDKNIVFNIGSEKEISIKDLALLVKKIVNPSLKIDILNKTNKSIGNATNLFYVPDTKLINTQLSVKELYSLEESIMTFEKFLRNKR